MNKIILILLLFLNPIFLFADETKIDRMESRLEIAEGKEKVDTLISLAKLYIADSSEKAKAYCVQASELAIRLNYKHGEALAAFCFGKIYRKLDEFDEALNYQHNALKIFKDNNNDTMIAQTEIELGLIYFMKPNIEQSINHFDQALDLYTLRNDSEGISIAYYNLGRCYRKAGKLDIALDNSMKSLRFNEKNNHNALNTISIIYAIMGDMDQAFEYQKTALNIREKLGLQEEVIGSLNNLGLISIRNKKLEQGLEYLLKSAKIAEEIGKKSQLNRTLSNIGFLYDEYFNEPEKALQYFQKSLKISKEIKESFETANTLINIGTLQSKLKQYDSALVNLELGFTLAKEINANELIRNAYVSISQHYERIEDYRQAFENYKSFVAIIDSIFSIESKNRIAEMQVKYETEKTEKENEIYKLKIEKNKLQNTLLYFGIIIFLILVIVFYFRYKIKTKASKLLKIEITERKKIESQLESRVIERTKELDKSNKELKKHRENLEELVKKRTGKLEEKAKKINESQQALTYLVEDVNESRTELDISNKKLEAANKELEAFSYSVSHDLRAPLRHIDGFTKLLNKNIKDIIDEKSQNHFDNITSSSKQMNQLIDDLLIFSRTSRKDMKKITVNMKTIINEAMQTFDSDIKENNISVIVDDMPDVNLDVSLIMQAWVNLISNAVKFTGKKEKPEIHIGTDKDTEGNNIFFIKDNGVGFDQKYVDKIFGVFQRLHNINEFPGTGIGLANVKRIITKHGGDIRAEGKINKGASFFFTIPNLDKPE